MADKSIGQLVAATQVTPTDLFVLEQSNTAKKLTGQVLENWLVSFADGHGGIQSIEKTGTSGFVDTYTITLADTTTMTFTVTNGKGIQSIATYWAVSSSGTTVPSNWSLTRQNMTATNRYLWSHQTITFNDGSIVNTTSSVVGVYGDKGNKGDTGNGIASLAQTSRVAGQYTVYTFTMTDGSTKSFYSYDGAGISNIERTSSAGLVDTYTITMTNGETDTFTVTNAKSITSVAMVSGTHAPGTTDTYRITFNDGDTTDFTVYNGTNGTGSVSAVDGIQAVSQNVQLLLTGNGAPTASTVGQLHQRYFDLTSHILYICTAIDASGAETTYSWAGTGVPVDSVLSTMSENPVQNKAIANRFATVETTLASKLPYSGGTMNGNIVMANHKITNLGDPTANGDAVNKSYADSIISVSDTQPTEAGNKLWVNTDASAGLSDQVPTVAEMEAADAQVAALIDVKHIPVWPTPTKYNSVQDVVDAMSDLPTSSFLLNTFGNTLKTDLFTTASSYDGFIVCFKASGNNIYYLAFSRDVAGIGNISIPNVSVTIKHSLL